MCPVTVSNDCSGVLQGDSVLLVCSLIQYVFHDAVRKYGTVEGLEEME
jgi:hypothetical protein